MCRAAATYGDEHCTPRVREIIYRITYMLWKILHEYFPGLWMMKNATHGNILTHYKIYYVLTLVCNMQLDVYEHYVCNGLDYTYACIGITRAIDYSMHVWELCMHLLYSWQ